MTTSESDSTGQFTEKPMIRTRVFHPDVGWGTVTRHFPPPDDDMILINFDGNNTAQWPWDELYSKDLTQDETTEARDEEENETLEDDHIQRMVEAQHTELTAPEPRQHIRVYIHLTTPRSAIPWDVVAEINDLIVDKIGGFIGEPFGPLENTVLLQIRYEAEGTL